MEDVIHCNSPLLVLDLGLDIVNGVRGLDLKGDGLSSEGLHIKGGFSGEGLDAGVFDIESVEDSTSRLDGLL